MADFSETMKKIILAGIGAAAETSQKAEELLDEMVKKGEITVEQGKVLNQELRHDIEQKWKEGREKARAEYQKRTVDYNGDGKKDFGEFLRSLTSDELAELKKKLDDLNITETAQEAAGKISETAQEAAESVRDVIQDAAENLKDLKDGE